MKSNKIVAAINAVFIFLVINYSIFVRFIIGFDSVGYGLSLLSVIVFLINFHDFERLQLSKPVLFWLIWCLYAFVNYYIHPQPKPMSIWVLYRRVFVPLITMTVVIKEYQNNSNKLLWLCFITHAAYMVLGVYFDTGIIYRNEEIDNELGNNYAIVSSFTLFYLVLLNRLRKISVIWSIVIIVIAMIVLSMAGTRKAFGACIIIICFWIYSIIQRRNVLTWILVGAFAFIGMKGYNALLENTYMGARMDALQEQQAEQLPSGAPEFLSIFGDRATHYYYGWKTFKRHPLFGEGTGQSMVGSSVSYVHSEYMSQLSDGGIVGFLLFSLFIIWMIKHILRQWHNDREIIRCIMGGMVAILFMYFTTWGWEFPQYFMCFGVIIGYCKMGKPIVESR